MYTVILDYIRTWFQPAERRKRRGSDSVNPEVRSPKQRRVLSPMSNNVMRDDYFKSPILPPHHSTAHSIVLDDEDDVVVTKPLNVRTRKLLENRTNGNDDPIFLKTLNSTTKKRLDANKSGFEYITRFTNGLSSSVTPNNQNGIKRKSKSTPVSKGTKPPFNFNTSALSRSVRLDEKKEYQKLLENVAAQNSMSETSIYGTPMGTPLFSRGRRLMELARLPKRPIDIIDLTEKSKLSTKDRVIKILDDFDSTPIEDSDSDVEILPTPPSPRPDIKVSPINSLKKIVDTSPSSHPKWVDDLTNRYARFVKDRSTEVEAYEANSVALNAINKDLRIGILSRRVQDSLVIKERILPVVEEPEEIELPELTREHVDLIKKAFSGRPNEVLTNKFNLNVTRADILTLKNLAWLNDNVINFYMNLIIERAEDSKWAKAYCMNTFFYPRLLSTGPESLRRWTKKVDLFSYEFICVPIHLGIHWCMAIINLGKKTIKYYDSMGASNDRCLNALRNYLELEHLDKKKEPYSTKDFVLENVKEIPQQMNGSDCGMFACTFAEFATRNARFTFEQEQMAYLRKKMVVEILRGHLLIS